MSGERLSGFICFLFFAVLQDEKGQINVLSLSPERDAVVYVHTENSQVLCATCWRDSSNDHEEHKEEKKHIVTGRIVAPNDMDAEELLSQIDNALSDLEHCNIYVPELCEQAGLKDRAEVDRRRYDLLIGN